MSDAVEQAKLYIQDKNYEEALNIAKKRHSKDDIEEYISILDLLIDEDYLLALEEKGMYYQYYDETHDNGDYGEKYFDEYLEKQPRSINALCDKAMSRFNKNKVDEALEYMDKAEEKYKSYSPIEKPRISKKEIKMGKIELLIQAKRYEEALTNLIYELGEYKEALKNYNHCIEYESKIDDLELLTNFNYKSAFCCVKLKDESEAIKYLNKTINMLNKHGRLPKDLEQIYQKCSFEKERIMKTGEVKDREFRKTRFFSARTSIIILIIILIMYVILKMNGY